jgi:hypothetical protein
VNKLLFLTLISLITSNALAMPNPASKNCVDKGGKLEIVTEKNGGQVGMCHLPNGVVCEEFALLRKECPATPKPAMLGGYTSVSVNNADVKQAASFAANQVSKGKAKLRKVTAAQTQVVAGLNYRLVIQLSNGQRYKVVVYKPLGSGAKLVLSSVSKL